MDAKKIRDLSTEEIIKKIEDNNGVIQDIQNNFKKKSEIILF